MCIRSSAEVRGILVPEPYRISGTDLGQSDAPLDTSGIRRDAGRDVGLLSAGAGLSQGSSQFARRIDSLVGSRRKVFLGMGVKFFQARCAAEIKRLPRVIDFVFCGRWIDFHVADRIRDSLRSRWDRSSSTLHHWLCSFGRLGNEKCGRCGTEFLYAAL